MAKRISYQGEPGANSHNACMAMFGDLEPVAFATFEEALGAVSSRAVDYAMIPIENSVAGRVADIHHLLPGAGLYIVGEHFERVRHQLMALPGASLDDIKSALSHTQALGQCRNALSRLKIKPVPEADTAGSARIVAESGDKTMAAIASSLAAEIYHLDILKADIEDEDHNTTRFVVLASDPCHVAPTLEGEAAGAIITSFLFRVRNVPAALYKAMGGFATNGVNMTKLESYQIGGTFNATMFYADVDGHPDDRALKLALEELDYFCSRVQILGTYKASPDRIALARRTAGDNTSTETDGGSKI